MKGICIVYITASGKKEALSIARALVGKRLAACVNIHNGINSVYRWKGGIERSSESVLFIKTRTALAPKIRKFVEKIHSYDLPCIITIPIAGSNRKFAGWIAGETKGGIS